GKPMAIRNGRRGQFLGCSAFPRCRTIKKMPEEGEYEIVARPEPTPKAAKPAAVKKETTTKKAATAKKEPKAKKETKAVTKDAKPVKKTTTRAKKATPAAVDETASA
ncbi:MAG TPA: topoisomerase DNA-binding C4 zinc finger domain-containing protein, partial [Armatimonadota bacterium]